MRNFFRSRVLFLATGIAGVTAFVGCGGPSFDKPKIDKFETVEFKLPLGFECLRKESEQKLSPSAVEFVVREEAATHYVEYVDCDGKVKEKAKEMVKPVEVPIDVKAPESLKSAVNFIEVENQRTCSTLKLDTKELDERVDKIVLENGKTIEIPVISSQADPSGFLRLVLTSVTDEFVPMLLEQVVALSGKNALKVRYMGKCLKYHKDKDKSKGDAQSCAKAKLLASQDITVDFKVTLLSPSKTTRVNQCRGKD